MVDPTDSSPPKADPGRIHHVLSPHRDRFEHPVERDERFAVGDRRFVWLPP